MNTHGRGGKKIIQPIKVFNNDPHNNLIILLFTVEVDAFVVLKPRKVRLYGFQGDPIKWEMTITPGKKSPFKIIDSRTKEGKNFKYEIKESSANGNTEYKLIAENTKKELGNYFDKIFVTTDSPEREEFEIHVYGQILENLNKKKAPPASKKN